MWRRKPDVEVTVTVGKFETAFAAMGAMDRFTGLAMKHRVDIKSSQGASMVMVGRPKRVAAFKASFDRLHAIGLV